MTNSNMLFQAIEEQNSEDVLRILSAGQNPNITENNWTGWTPLHYAVEAANEGGSLDMVTTLITKGADVNKWNSAETSTPIILAVFENNITAAQILLNAGSDPNVCSGQGDSPLRVSVTERNDDMVTLLLNFGANKDIDKFGGDMGLTPLGIAAGQLDIKMVKLLVDAGADLNIRDDEHKTARENVPEFSPENEKEWNAMMELLHA